MEEVEAEQRSDQLAKRIFGLIDVPEEEIKGIKKSLSREGISFYETPGERPGNYRTRSTSGKAIWVDDQDVDRAVFAIEKYQKAHFKPAAKNPIDWWLKTTVIYIFLLILIGIGIAIFG